MGTYTVGLKQIKTGDAIANGAIDDAAINALTKTFKVYDDSCTIEQGDPEVTEFKEENNAVPVVAIADKKPINVKFQMMDTDANNLTTMLGGAPISGLAGSWGYDGSDDVENRCFYFETLQGMDFCIPNGKISAKLGGKLARKGLVLVDVTVTPEAVTEAGNKPFVAISK